MRKPLLLLLALAITSVAFAGFVNLRLGLSHGAQVAPVNCSNNPLTCPLVQSSDTILTFLGSFTAPNNGDFSAFSAAGYAMSVSGTTMYEGGSGFAIIGSFAIPTLSGTAAYDGSNGGPATETTVPVKIGDATTGANFGQINCGGGAGTALRITGTLVYGGKLLMAGGPYFDVAGCATAFIVGASTTVTSIGTPNSASTANSTYQRYFAGSLGVVPSAWRAYFAGPCFVTSAASADGDGLSVAYRSPAGLMFSTFDCGAYNSSGGSISVTENLDYYWNGGDYTHALVTYSYSGPFPLAGGGGDTFTLTGAPSAGATSVTLNATFPGYSYTVGNGPNVGSSEVFGNLALGGFFQVTFSDGETRNVHMGTNGATSIPDGFASCATGCASFAALTCSPSCTSSITLNPIGDNYMPSEGYSGNYGYGFIVPGSRTLLFINSAEYGMDLPPRGAGCEPNSSGGDNVPVSPDSQNYSRLQVSAYDLGAIYTAIQGGQPVWTVKPYAFWTFPGQSHWLTANGCMNIPIGGFFFDPNTNILYGSVEGALGSNGGTQIVNEWSVSGT